MFNIFPLSDGRVRIMADGSSLDPNEELTIEKLEKVCQACAAPYKIRILDSKWLTFYKVNERRAETYSHKSRIFLAGDAAHVHSPVGGQGNDGARWLFRGCLMSVNANPFLPSHDFHSLSLSLSL
jgi:2-polyprenyl-6-methoxyphenol hydroxylase-like FAD-dependent oxidoreductase